MSARNLLARAREIIQNRGATGALVIVPLALAAQAQAASVPFALGTSTISRANTGGAFFGNAAAALVGQGVRLTGDTLPPDLQSTPPVYLPASLAHENNGVITFTWNGSFSSGTVATTDLLFVDYELDLAAILSVPPGHHFGAVSWTLNVGIYSIPGPYLDSDFLIASYAAGDSGLGNFSGADTQHFTAAVQPLFWSAQLDITWALPTIPDPSTTGHPLIAAFADDQLSATPLINLSMISDTGTTPANPVPLPPAVWIGGMLIVGLAGHRLWCRRAEQALRWRNS